MTKMLHLFALTIAILLGSIAAPAAAAPPREFQGTVLLTSFVTAPEARTTGNVVHSDAVSTSRFLSGPVHGTTQNALRCLTIGGDTLRCHVISTFTGSIDGIGEGTTASRQHFTCDLTTFSCEGRFGTISGTGGLANYRDVGSYWTVGGGVLAYQVRVLQS